MVYLMIDRNCVSLVFFLHLYSPLFTLHFTICLRRLVYSPPDYLYLLCSVRADLFTYHAFWLLSSYCGWLSNLLTLGVRACFALFGVLMWFTVTCAFWCYHQLEYTTFIYNYFQVLVDLVVPVSLFTYLCLLGRPSSIASHISPCCHLFDCSGLSCERS